MSTNTPIDDGNLLSDITAIAERGDRGAFGRLFGFYAPRIKSYLKRLGAEDGTAEDLVQEVMLTVWRRAGQFDPSRAALSTWIYTIARNKRIDALRRQRHPEIDPDDPALAQEPPPRADVQFEAEQMKDRIKTAVAALPSEQAEMLRIFYFEEKTHSAIADSMGLPLGTVKSRLRLAVGKLRVLLEGTA